MVAATEHAAALYGPEIGDFLHHAELGRIAASIGANGAGVGGIEVAADGAGADGLAGFNQRGHERGEQLLAVADEVQHRAPGRTRPEARQFCKQRNEVFEHHRQVASIKENVTKS